MSLYDMIDDISARQATKTETGDTRINGVVLGVVTKLYDENIKGRVCVQIPTRDNEANELVWARVSQPSSGASWGHYFLPEVEDQVLLAFEGGNIERPYVIGCVPKDNSKLVSGHADQPNSKKAIVTTSGNRITFTDTEEKEIIDVATAKDAFSITMENEAKKITITDKEKENQIVIAAGDAGKITIKAANKCEILVGEVKVIINGQSGAVSIESQKVNIKASTGISMKTDGNMSLEAANLTLKASASLKASSDGVTQISGSIVKNG